MDQVGPPEAGSCVGCAARDQQIAQLQAQLTQMTQRVARLEEQLAAALRQEKRQAAPFSQGPPKARPKRPGRKAGKDYGKKAHRQVPPRIDQVYQAQLPRECPACGGDVRQTHVAQQYQVEIPRRPVYRQFNVPVGRCRCCGRRVQGRHRLQSSDALGCCASQLGPEAQAAVVLLNKELGLSHGKISRLLQELFAIPLSLGGSCQVVLRAAERCRPIHQQIRHSIRSSEHLRNDETGWKVAGRYGQLHVAVGDEATLYHIDRQRGVDAISKLIGVEYAGTMTHDGFASYDWFCWAEHQQCLSHLLRRCKDLEKTLQGEDRKWVQQVKRVLKEALRVRDQRESGQLSLEQTRTRAERLQERMEQVLGQRTDHELNRRLAKHLWKHQRQWFVFLRQAGVDATNYQAEQALRPAVVNRKVWGGSRTERGAEAQAIVMSVLRTARQRHKPSLELLSRTLRCKDPLQRVALLFDSS